MNPAQQQSLAYRKVVAARTTLVLQNPFFGALALKLRLKEDPSCKTAWTDGQSMGFNPDFIENLTQGQLRGLIAHEVMHCALGHPWRREGREQKRFNVACDYALNPELLKSSFELPDGALQDPQFDGKSAEWIYDRLPPSPPGGSGCPNCDPNGNQGEQQEGQDGGQGQDDQDGQDGDQDQDGQGGGQGDQGDDQQDGGGQGGGQGQDNCPNCQDQDAPGQGGQDVRDAPSSSSGDGESSGNSEQDWKQAVHRAAAAAKARGNFPAHLDRFAEQAARSAVDWRSVLRRFVQQVQASDYSWRRPNQRYIASGLYLPALHADAMGPVVVVVDTSGSIDQITLGQFSREIQSVIDEARPERTHVLYCDAKVHGHDVFEPTDVVSLENAAGGGGTDFRPAINAAQELDDEPACLIYLTDLYGSHTEDPPPFPVLWVTTGSEDAPYGEIVPLKY